jgi:hypothetical protein
MCVYFNIHETTKSITPVVLKNIVETLLHLKNLHILPEMKDMMIKKKKRL